ncbi:STAS domain-containing protein [Candidatus Sumerlaeota bacterium]|nr:STAS domain-containing protein [Candidatus Sumerlaeota bacterium]
MKQESLNFDFNRRPNDRPQTPWDHLENLSWAIVRLKESSAKDKAALDVLMALRKEMLERCEFITLQAKWEFDTLIILPNGGLDVQTSHSLQAELQQLGALRPQLLIIDCSRLTGIVSMLIGTMLQLQNLLAKHYGKLVLAQVNDVIRDALESARITQFIPIAISIDAARSKYESIP